jgi:membrane-associated protease RseP (regulator of RpoE activity)
MFDPAPESSRPLTRSERWIYAGFSLFLLGCYVAEVVSDFEPVKLSILFMILAWPPLLVLHEAGHALVARWLGWRLEAVVIGFGRPLVRGLRVGGVDVEIRSLPVEGFVRCSSRDLAGVRWKSAAIYFAGPGIELLFTLLLLLAFGADILLTRSQDVGVIALQSLALASVVGGVVNLIPHSTLGRDGEIPNDGLGILLSLRRPLRDWEAEQRARRFFEPDED